MSYIEINSNKLCGENSGTIDKRKSFEEEGKKYCWFAKTQSIINPIDISYMLVGLKLEML